MADELIDIADENNNLTGIRKMKSEAHKSGLWHRASHIWIYNDIGEILLQFRSGEKKLYPRMWDVAAAGHIGAGEDPAEAAVRETLEEIGIPVALKDLDFWGTWKIESKYEDIRNNEFLYIYLYRFNGNEKELVLQKEEVEAVRFFSADEIREGLKNESRKYVSQGNYWLEMMEAIGHRLAKSEK